MAAAAAAFAVTYGIYAVRDDPPHPGRTGAGRSMSISNLRWCVAHAWERMTQRGISEEQVYAALAHEQRRTPGQGGTVWIHGLTDEGTLKVCVSADQTKVITAAWPGE